MVKPTYLLDTNTWIYALKGNAPHLVARLGLLDPDKVAFCSVVKAELWHGAQRYGNRQQRLTLLQTLFHRHHSFAFADQSAEIYGQIRHRLEANGERIGPMDLLIASIALAEGLILVTNNTAEFSRIAELQLENWLLVSDSNPG